MKENANLVKSFRLRSGNALYISECPVKYISNAKKMLSVLLHKEGECVLDGACTVSITNNEKPVTSISFTFVVMLYNALVEPVNYGIDIFEDAWKVLSNLCIQKKLQAHLNTSKGEQNE